MSRKAPLFDIGLINEDLRVRSMSMMAQLLFIKFVALANDADGFIRLRARVLDLKSAAQVTGFGADEVLDDVIEEIMLVGLLEQRGKQWCIPEMVDAHELRVKRQKAGAKGGQRTTTRRSDICSSKRSSNVISFEKSKAYEKRGESGAKKEKRTKKEKNNKYIFIYKTRVFTGDRGQESNPSWFEGQNIRLFKRDFEAIQGVFSEFEHDELWDLLEKQDRWLSDEGSDCRGYWLAVTLKFLRAIHDAKAKTLEQTYETKV